MFSQNASEFKMECNNIKLRPCLEAENCYDGESTTALCWIFTFMQLCLAVSFLTYPCFTTNNKKKRRSVRKKNSDTKEAASSKLHASIPPSAPLRSGMVQFSARSRSMIYNQQQPILNFTAVSDEQDTEDFLPDLYVIDEEAGFNNRSTPFTSELEDIESRPSLDSVHRSIRRGHNFAINHEEQPKNDSQDSSYGKHSKDNDAQQSLSECTAAESSHLNRWHLQKPDLASPVFYTQRSEKNFMKKNEDATIDYPSDYEPEYITVNQNNGATTTNVLKSIFSSKASMDMLRSCTGFAFLASGISSLFGIFFAYGEYLDQNCGDAGVPYIHIKAWLIGGAAALDHTVESFKFLPLFLVLAAFAFLVDRWQRFMVTCHTIQGRLHDIGILCGSLPTSPITELSQRKLYTVYRYLNVIHILCLKSFSPSLRELNNDISILASELNLLTEEEIGMVASMDNKARDGMIGLLSVAVDDLLKLSDGENIVAVSKGTVLSAKICDLRSECSKLHDLFVRDNPNEYTASIGVFIQIFKALILMASPLGMIQESTYGVLTCIQPGVFIGVLFTFLSLSFPFILFKALQNPFAEEGGIDVDNLIASTELCLFHTTRVLWHTVEEKDSTRKSTRQNWSNRRSALSKSRKGEYGDL